MIDTGYRRIVEHYEGCLDRHGDTHLGVDWPRFEDAEIRYRVMLDLIRPTDQRPTLLDFGCGLGHLYQFIRQEEASRIEYHGLDLSPRFVELCQVKYPDVNFSCEDILNGPTAVLPTYDYVVANGVFTEKRELSQAEMLGYFEAMIPRLFALARVGIAFNVMSKQVDWERDDLFHLPLDTLAWFLTRKVTRHFMIRNDYGLYEYTVYAFKEPRPWPKSSSSV
jgi:SAM-dependent methyltransferase